MDFADVYQDVKDVGAKVYPYEIGFCDAATIELNGQYGIFLDLKKFHTIRDIIWALEHETAHCATGCTHKLSSGYDLIEKHEYKANRYVIEKYLSVQDLCAAMQAGYSSTFDLAEYFNVPESAIKKALHYWTECRGINFNDLKEAN